MWGSIERASLGWGQSGRCQTSRQLIPVHLVSLVQFSRLESGVTLFLLRLQGLGFLENNQRVSLILAEGRRAGYKVEKDEKEKKEGKEEQDTDPIYLLGLSVVRSEAENLCEMGECPVHVILVVEAQAPHVNSVGVHVVELQNGVRSLGGLVGKCIACIFKSSLS